MTNRKLKTLASVSYIHPKKPLNTSLWSLAKSNHPANRRQAANSNPSHPAILYHLVLDKDPEVRKSLAKNLHSPKNVLESLALDQDPDIRLEVIKNPKTPMRVLKALILDPHPTVRSTSSSYLLLRQLKTKEPISIFFALESTDSSSSKESQKYDLYISTKEQASIFLENAKIKTIALSDCLINHQASDLLLYVTDWLRSKKAP